MRYNELYSASCISRNIVKNTARTENYRFWRSILHG